MKFLWVLCVVSGVSALAIDHNMAPSRPNPEVTAELNMKQPGSDLAERSENHRSGLEKRAFEEIPIPYGEENPQSIVKLGIVISFIMAGKWVREGTRNVWTYVCKAVKFSNGGNVGKAVTMTSGFATYVENQVVPPHKAIAIGAVPEGFKDKIRVYIS